MKKVLVLCCLMAASLLYAGQSVEQKGEEAQGALGMQGTPIAMTSAADQHAAELAEFEHRGEEKTLYYSLVEKLVAGTATEAEMLDIDDLSAVYGLPNSTTILNSLAEEFGDRNGGSLDQGSGVCDGSEIIISGCPYADTGLLDGDNDCSTPTASPNNEVFYTFTPGATGVYIFRVRNGTTGASAIRIMSGTCCTGAVSVAFSSGSAATDCPNIVGGGVEPSTVVTYLRATLNAGTQYWIHVGTSSATVSTASYEFNMWCQPACPANEVASHGTCATAQFVACGDSVYGDSAITTTPDWYAFTVGGTGADVTIRVTGRELLHCNSGYYPAVTSSNPTGALGPVDGRFSIWTGCGGLPADSFGVDDDGGTTGPGTQVVTCQFDAGRTFGLTPGTYYVRVYNYGVQEYIFSVSCVQFPDCANDVVPCGPLDEIEPNNLCADAANILPITACGQVLNGTVCPASDVDYWYVPATPPGLLVTVTIWDGVDCSLNAPPAAFALRLAGAGACTVPSGSFFSGIIFGGPCIGWGGGYIAVSRYVANSVIGAYQLRVTCSDTAFVCPCDVGDPGQECFSCVGLILDNQTFTYDLPVNTEYHITDLDVCVDITHSFRGDVTLWLVTPWGDTILLQDNRGSGGNNWIAVSFDDEAGASISTSPTSDNLTGSWIPEEPLSAVDGYNALGLWQIIVNDQANLDQGYINCICLNFDYDYILGVELADFDAIAGDGEITLAWVTASETDNDRFELMRDGAKVAEVNAVNSATGSTYSWTDSNVKNGTTYSYTLVSVDVDGAREELGTVSATPNFGSATVTEYALQQNYPNPFNPTTNISFDLVEAGFVKLSVYNLLGQEVAKVVSSNLGAGRHTVTFDATGLSSGLYMYKMEVNGFAAQKKLLLLK